VSTDPTTAPAPIKGDGTVTVNPSVADGDGKEALIAACKDALLAQHLHPGTTEDGTKLTRFEDGTREGQIVAYIDVLRHFPGTPDYSETTEAALRAMLLGQALTDHYGG
jgi:hypothetical protein